MGQIISMKEGSPCGLLSVSELHTTVDMKSRIENLVSNPMNINASIVQGLKLLQQEIIIKCHEECNVTEYDLECLMIIHSYITQVQSMTTEGVTK